MSSELTLMVLRLGFLLLLWLFVFSVLFALRSDLFGAPVRRMKKNAAEAVPQVIKPTPEPRAAAPAPAPQVSAPPPVASSSTPDGLPSAAADGPPKKLVILTGVAEGSTIPLDDSVVTIGRSPDSTFVIVDEYTSTYHAKLHRTGDVWRITDLDSTNGTKVSGERINETLTLPPFTPVTIGTTTFELRP